MTKVSELINTLKKFDGDTKVLVSSDEELNVLFSDFEIAELSDREKTIVIYGLSGSEIE